MKKTIIAALALTALVASSCSKQAATAEPEEMGAYVLAYFMDSDHSLRLATSHDGYTFTAVNDGNPIVSADTISDQKGIRDPHIYRGPDGRFYIAVTDLHVFGQQAGVRDTKWERPDEYGWGNNRGFVFLTSDDMVNWTHHNVRLDELFPDELSQIGCAWAPQIIYDPAEEKMMVYFTLRKVGEYLPEGSYSDKRTQLYYAYADSAFTTLVTKPELLYTYPDSTVQVLDADICPLPDGRYMLTYCAQEQPGGIKVAFSDRINGGYNYLPDQVDGEEGACEAPQVWKRNGEDKWVVMYDVFSIRPNNFGFVETSDFTTFTPLGHFNDGVMKTTNFERPKHGAVTPVTLSEALKLEQAYPNHQ